MNMRIFNVICKVIKLFYFILQLNNKQKGFLKKLNGKIKPNKEYPLILRRDVYRVKHQTHTLLVKDIYLWS